MQSETSRGLPEFASALPVFLPCQTTHVDSVDKVANGIPSDS
jgi:hypothetical protein